MTATLSMAACYTLRLFEPSGILRVAYDLEPRDIIRVAYALPLGVRGGG